MINAEGIDKMDDMNSKPDGFYDAIDFPCKRKADLYEFFKEYTIQEHTNSEKGYDYLFDDDIVLEIINPYQSEPLFIELADRFTLFFKDWHVHYFSYEYDYALMKKDAMSILKGDYGVLCCFIEEKWTGSTLLEEKVTHLSNPEALIEMLDLPKEHLQEIKKKGAAVFANYWNPVDCYEFAVSKAAENPRYSFPRRAFIRFVIRDGKCFGSGGIKQYDEKRTFLYFSYVDGTEDDRKVHAALIQQLEKDAKKNGSEIIFVNVENATFEWYASLGYKEIERIENERIVDLQGAHVIFDKTVAKAL